MAGARARSAVATVAVWAALTPWGAGGAAGPADRAVAVTFDDLPATRHGSLADVRRITGDLLAHLDRLAIPATGFVNEIKLARPGEEAERAALLEAWLDRGHDLGNHTYSHRSFNTTPLEEFQEDVVRGEMVTRRLLAERGSTLRYFRHPFLQVGLDLGKRRALETFLQEKGYRVAPVTIDNDEYMYAAVYADALRRGDRASARKVGRDYLRYMDSVVSFAQEVALRLTGREIPQILLLHANALNADHFGSLARSLRRGGYRFVTLEEALGDAVYDLPDTYVGRWGISWLHHWELTAGRERSPSPDPPSWLTDAYGALRQP